MLLFHRQQDAALTIATQRASVATELGVIVHQSGIVTDYREKPTLQYSASMGIYMYEPRALAMLPDGPCQFPELVLALLQAGQRVTAYETDADWYHIGTHEQHFEATRRLGFTPDG
jgi:NDP-sugar pyrophosphorylase family protein